MLTVARGFKTRYEPGVTGLRPQLSAATTGNLLLKMLSFNRIIFMGRMARGKRWMKS